MIILGIETSCDETAMSLVKIENSKIEVLTEVVASQEKIHEKYGGVYPFLAKREHQKNLPIIEKKISKKFDFSKIDLIAVTKGPGLEPCLWQGINYSKELAKKIKIPIVGVNHLEAHIFANFIEKFEIIKSKKIFPAICLVISGGHTNLFLAKKICRYKFLGETRDDAVGECFDKVGRIFGFSYPAGPKITNFLKKYQNLKVKFKVSLPRPMLYQKNYDFSFSGLKTAVLYLFLNTSKKLRNSKEFKLAVFRELENAISEVLIKKTILAAKNFKVKSILIGGGVIADDFLRISFKKICQEEGFNVFFPKKKYSTDNATMVALAGYFQYKKRGASKNLRAVAKLKI